MNVLEIRRTIAEIAAGAGDPERQHGSEDELLHDVLEAIADGADNPQELAREALAVQSLTFPRWYA